MTKTEASAHEHALPMIVTHGRPGSIIEQLKIIGPLTNPLLDFMQLGGSVWPIRSVTNQSAQAGSVSAAESDR